MRSLAGTKSLESGRVTLSMKVSIDRLTGVSCHEDSGSPSKGRVSAVTMQNKDIDFNKTGMTTTGLGMNRGGHGPRGRHAWGLSVNIKRGRCHIPGALAMK
jgi:hypothetical protein